MRKLIIKLELNFIIKLVCADNCFYCDLPFYNMNIFLAYLELNHPFRYECVEC